MGGKRRFVGSVVFVLQEAYRMGVRWSVLVNLVAGFGKNY